MPTTRVGRNDPCPCGSGRKYKHCCLKVKAGNGQAAYAREPDESPEVEPWTGIAVDHLTAIISEPFDVPGLVGFDLEPADAGSAPIVLAFLCLARALEGPGAPIASDGGLTAETVAEVVRYLQADSGDELDLSHAEHEEDLASLPMARIVGELAGLVERRSGRFAVSARCRRLLDRDDATGIFRALFEAHVTKLDWSSLDPFPDLQPIEGAWPVTLLLLNRFGHRPRPSQFYADAFLAMFDDLGDELVEDLRSIGAIDADEPTELDADLGHGLAGFAYTLRAIVRFAALYGLVSVEPLVDEDGEPGRHFVVHATTQLPRLMQVHVPQLPAEAMLGEALEELEDTVPATTRFVAPGPVPATTSAAPDDPLAALQAAMDERSFASLDEARAFADTFFDEFNRRPLDAFRGLSPAQMHVLLTAPFEADEVLQLTNTLPPGLVTPVTLLFESIADACGERGVRATGTGRLPRSLCRDAFERYREAGYPTGYLRSARDVHSEVDFHPLYETRVTARRAGLLRLTHGRWHLTRAARRILARSGPGGAYPMLLRAYVEHHDWSEADGCPWLAIVQRSWAFTVYLLHRLGARERPGREYGDAFLEAFPLALEEAEQTPGWRPSGVDPITYAKRQVGAAYELRALERFAGMFGLATISTEPYDVATGERPTRVRAGPALSAAFEFTAAS
jgi:hypothetical protein